MVADGKIKDDRSLYPDGPADALHKADDLNDHKREEEGEQKTQISAAAKPVQTGYPLQQHTHRNIEQPAHRPCQRRGYQM